MLVPADAETPAGDSLSDLARRTALVHDFGKLTDWFRQHLLEDVEPDGPTHHAPLGAIVAHHVLSASGFEGADPLIGFLAVAKHHGRLPDVTPYVAGATVGQAEGTLKRLFRSETVEQVEQIDATVPDLAVDLIDRATDGRGSWASFRDEMLDVREQQEHVEIARHVCRGRFLEQRAPEQVPGGLYAALLQVWSALVFADKTSAASLTTGVDLTDAAHATTVPAPAAIETHIGRLQAAAATAEIDERTRELNDQREAARQTVRSRVEEFVASDEPVATLTLPTGLGKTLTGLDAALTILQELPGDGRVIYALPFTSIIDQVASESREMFDAGVRGDILTVDHHLSDTVVDPPMAEEVSDDERAHLAAMLGESWRSGVVVTTFVQLFESLAGPRNGQSMKLPALYDSVVILDEPQALPLEWWPLAERLVDLMTEEYRARVIAMTATQPRLFTGGDVAAFPLVDDPDPYFASLDRVTFELHPSAEAEVTGSETAPIGYAPAATLIGERLHQRSSVLAICNTIDSARELVGELLGQGTGVNVNAVYERLLGQLDGYSETLDPRETVRAAMEETAADTARIIHLSTRHRPCDRQHLLEVASRLAADRQPVALVSTQLVEAGVDVSFDEVFRDFAPLDNIVQAAGRCNRSFDRERGRVTIWLLAPPPDRSEPPSRAIYGMKGPSLTRLTANALAHVYDGDPLPEPVITRDAVERYFAELDARGVGRSEYVDWVDRSEAEALGRLSLIDQRRAVDVFVARTASEVSDHRRAVRLYEQGRWQDLEGLLDSMGLRQISVPLYASDDADKKLVHLEPVHQHADRRVLDARADHHAGYFDATEGFVIPDSTVEARFL